MRNNKATPGRVSSTCSPRSVILKVWHGSRDAKHNKSQVESVLKCVAEPEHASGAMRLQMKPGIKIGSQIHVKAEMTYIKI